MTSVTVLAHVWDTMASVWNELIATAASTATPATSTAPAAAAASGAGGLALWTQVMTVLSSPTLPKQPYQWDGSLPDEVRPSTDTPNVSNLSNLSNLSVPICLQRALKPDWARVALAQARVCLGSPRGTDLPLLIEDCEQLIAPTLRAVTEVLVKTTQRCSSGREMRRGRERAWALVASASIACARIRPRDRRVAGYWGLIKLMRSNQGVSKGTERKRKGGGGGGGGGGGEEEEEEEEEGQGQCT